MDRIFPMLIMCYDVQRAINRLQKIYPHDLAHAGRLLYLDSFLI
jgi:hypothetical protein